MCDGGGTATNPITVLDDVANKSWLNPPTVIKDDYCSWSCSKDELSNKKDNGTWTKLTNNQSSFSCNKGYSPSSTPSPTATCNTIKSRKDNNRIKYSSGWQDFKCSINCDSSDGWKDWVPIATPTCLKQDKSNYQKKYRTPKFSTCNPSSKTRDYRHLNIHTCTSPPKPKPKTGTTGGVAGGSSDYTPDFYDSPDRSSLLATEYASIHADYSTVEDLNNLITEFYTPNCSLHLDVPDETLMKNPNMGNIVANPGYAHCV